MKVVAVDESGNTGADLLNEDQRIFVLASSDLSLDEANVLIREVQSKQAKEVKFETIKKSRSGRRRLETFLKNASSQTERFATTVFHKDYMVITKMVDFIVEPLAKQDGIDIYKDGANLALSNLHYSVMPTFCGQNETRNFKEAFIRMIREQTNDSVQRFYQKAWELYDTCRNEKYKALLSPFFHSRIPKIIENLGANALDPSIPGFFDHCAYWGDYSGEKFDVLHDNSKPIFQEKDSLEQCMLDDIPDQVIGYDRRQVGFPLKAKGVNFGDSKEDSRLQVVDLLASSTAYWANGIAKNQKNSQLWQILDEIDPKQFTLRTIWPSLEVTPSELGTDGGGGTNPVDRIAHELTNLQSKK